MSYLIFGGLGMQGKAILHYLVKNTKNNIIVVDKHEVNILPQYIKDKYHEYTHRLFYIQCCQSKPLGDVFIDVSIKFGTSVTVINCLPTEYNLSITEMCGIYKFNLVDLGGVTDVVRQQFKVDFPESTAVPDCGLAPGIISSLAALLEEDGWNSVKFFCGGVPKHPKPPLSYVEVFYPGGVIKEFSGVTQEIQDGVVVNVPARSGRELIYISGFGVLEAVVTSGGLSLTPEHSSLNNLSYKTLRYPGHIDYLNEYIFTQPDPAATLSALLEKVDKDNPDIIILHIKLKETDYNDSITYVWEYDAENNFSAMSQATGYTVAAVATMISDGLIRKGVVGMHEIDANEIINRARKMPGQYCELLESK